MSSIDTALRTQASISISLPPHLLPMQTLLHVTMYDNPCLCPGLSHFPIFVHPLEHKFCGVRSCVLLNTLSPALKALSDMSQVLNGCCALPALPFLPLRPLLPGPAHATLLWQAILTTFHPEQGQASHSSFAQTTDCSGWKSNSLEGWVTFSLYCGLSRHSQHPRWMDGR